MIGRMFDESTKDSIWHDLKQHFVIPESDNPDPKKDALKKKMDDIFGGAVERF